MDPKLFRAATAGDVDVLKSLPEDILEQVTPISSTPLHIAAMNGHWEFCRDIHIRCQNFLSKANKNGDTPFHLAARAGHMRTIGMLITCAKDSHPGDLERGRSEAVEILRMVNNGNETVMHEAVRSCNLEMVKRLIKEDPQLLCMVNTVGESPLHVSVDKGNIDIVKVILQTKNCSYNGPNGRTALHAAIVHREQGITDLLLGQKHELLEVADGNGRTPLHFASKLGFLATIQMLLKENTSTPYLLDKYGYAPIHMAVLRGQIEMIAEFLHCRPDLKYLLDGRGRNILHMAVESKQVHVVRYIIKRRDLEELLNDKDKDGNTPLHQAAIAGHPYIVNLLLKERRVDLMALNKNHLTALDIARSQAHASTEQRQAIILAMFVHVASPPWCDTEGIHEEIFRCGMNKRYMSIEWYNHRATVLMVVATLVATVTFAAGFTMPGGYHSSGIHEGRATLLQNKKFRTFVLLNALAMYSSTAAVVSLIWIQFIHHLTITIIILYGAQIVTIIALSLMTLAFMTGVNLSVAGHTSLTVSLSFFGYSTFCAIFAATFVQHITPYLYASKHYTFFGAWAYRFAIEDFTSFCKGRKSPNDISDLFTVNDVNSVSSETPDDLFTVKDVNRGSSQIPKSSHRRARSLGTVR